MFSVPMLPIDDRLTVNLRETTKALSVKVVFPSPRLCHHYLTSVCFPTSKPKVEKSVTLMYLAGTMNTSF